MERVTYPPGLRKQLKTYEWNSRNTNYGHRVAKMLRPICKECQGDPNHPTNWYEVCPHFEDKRHMYWARQTKIIKIPTIVEDEDGDQIVEKEDIKTKLILVPNWTEVPLDSSHNDGQGYAKAKAKGFVLPEEIGLAPMCQYSGCGRAWPSIRTAEGDYCNEYHAKIAAANQNEINLQAPGLDDKIRKQQVAEIPI